MKKEINAWQIAFFFIAFLPVTKFFIVPSLVVRISAEDMWISILISLTLDFITLISVMLLNKNNSLSYYENLEISFGKKPTKIILFMYAICFILKTIMPISEQQDYVIYTLYISNSNAFFYAIAFIIPFYLAIKDLKSVGRCSTAVWLLTVISVFLIIVLSVLNINLNALLPVGANGLNKVLRGSYRATGWFGDCIFFVFFMGRYQKTKRSSLIVMLGFIIASVMVLAFSIIFWCSFTSIAFRQRFALTELSKYVTIVNNIGRFDYIAIFFILFADILAVSMPVFFATEIICKVFNTDKKWIPALAITSILFILEIFLSRLSFIFEVFLASYGGVIFLIFFNVLPIVTVAISRLKQRRNYEIQNS